MTDHYLLDHVLDLRVEREFFLGLVLLIIQPQVVSSLFVLGQGSSFKQQATSWSIGLGRYARHALGIIPGETYRKPASHKQLDKIKFIVYRIIKE